MAQNTTGGDCPKVEAWELELVGKVARAFRTYEHEELEAELAKKLVELKLNLPDGIRDWKAYLAKFLYNKASNIIRDWRNRESKFVSFAARSEDDTEEMSEAALLKNILLKPKENHELKTELSGVWEQLAPELRELWEILVEEEGDRSAAAKRLGKHRNTVGLWIKRIQEELQKHGFSGD